MNKTLYVIVFFLFVALYYWLFIEFEQQPLGTDKLSIVLLSNPVFDDDFDHILESYKRVLEEEGFSYRHLQPSELLSSIPSEFSQVHPVIILPDGAARVMPEQLGYWMREYLQHGGNVALIYDAGTMSMSQAYLQRPLFQAVVYACVRSIFGALFCLKELFVAFQN